MCARVRLNKEGTQKKKRKGKKKITRKKNARWNFSRPPAPQHTNTRLFIDRRRYEDENNDKDSSRNRGKEEEEGEEKEETKPNDDFDGKN